MNSRSITKLIRIVSTAGCVCLLTSCQKRTVEEQAKVEHEVAESKEKEGQRLFATGLSTFASGDHSNAFVLFTRAARSGHREAEARVGWMYLQGDGVDKNATQGASWLQKSAQAGYVRAENDFGVLNQRGLGVTVDPAAAVEWYSHAAKEGFTNAEYNLAIMYLRGAGVTSDCVKASEWMRKAAEQGHRRAQTALGVMAVDGCGMPTNYLEAAKWFAKAASNDDAAAQANLGAMQHAGIGIVTNYVDALQNFSKAAAQGSPQVAEELAAMLISGEAGHTVPARAVELLKSSAAQNYAPAQFDLGVLYSQGLGVARDKTEALRLFKLAADQGHDLARVYVRNDNWNQLIQLLNAAPIILNSGEVVPGRVVSETETNVEIESPNRELTIYNLRTIAKADIKSIRHETPEQVAQRTACLALLKYKLNPDQELTTKAYGDAIDKFGAFLDQYPQSQFAPGIQTIQGFWQYESNQRSKDLVKFGEVWMTPAEKQLQLVLRKKNADAQRQFLTQHKTPPKKTIEIQDSLQSAQQQLVELIGKLSDTAASQSQILRSLHEMEALERNIESYQFELGIQYILDAWYGRTTPSIGHANLAEAISSITTGVGGEGTWLSNDPEVGPPLQPLPVSVWSGPEFGPLINPVAGN